MKRRKEREIIVLSLYSMEISENDLYETVHYILEQLGEKDQATEYIYQSIKDVRNKIEELGEIISNNLENYKISRLSYIDLAIIRFATYELLLKEDIPGAVIINEAIEITKKYSDLGDNKAAAFNNRLLDKIKVSIRG